MITKLSLSRRRLLAGLFLCLTGSFVLPRNSAAETIRFGHFPNVTHAQGVIAHGLSRAGKGWFEQRLGSGVQIQWFTYNAGPSAMEAIFAGSLDLTYVGQGPALNAYFKSEGEEIRVLSGAATGGAALVVRPDAALKVPADFRGKTIATPQLGNTQDISCRAWLKAQGFKVTQTGGDVKVLPVANPDQLSAFQQKQVDGVWTVEPWVTRLEREAGGKSFPRRHSGADDLAGFEREVSRRAPGPGEENRGCQCRVDAMDSDASGGSAKNSRDGTEGRNQGQHRAGVDRASLEADQIHHRGVASNWSAKRCRTRRTPVLPKDRPTLRSFSSRPNE